MTNRRRFSYLNPNPIDEVKYDLSNYIKLLLRIQLKAARNCMITIKSLHDGQWSVENMVELREFVTCVINVMELIKSETQRELTYGPL
jgi:hypothetical protein